MRALNDWVQTLSNTKIPVLANTIAELDRLRPKQDSVSPREVAQIVLRDPLMTLTVLRFSQSRLTKKQSSEVTTIQHVLMMHGLQAFFREMRELVPVEQQLQADKQALEGLMRVVSRAIHGAGYARTLASLRHDVDGDEVVTSALLHDLAEMMLWYVIPTAAVQIEHMLHFQRGLRSASAQKLCLGFTIVDLQLALAKEWKLPTLLQALMDDQHPDHPRTRAVARASALARHSANGWFDPALPDDFKEIQKITNLPADQATRWMRQAALQSARAWKQTGIRPAAAWLPMLPGEWPEEETLIAQEDAMQLIKRVLDQLAQVARDTDVQSIIALLFYALNSGLGLRRLWFGRVNESTLRIEPRQALLLDAGLLPGELAFEMKATHLFARLMGKAQGLWFAGALRDKLTPLLPPALAPKLEKREFYVMSLHVRGHPFGMVYADGGAGRPGLSEKGFTVFKALCLAATQALEKTAR